jgi:hypothetical protein
VGPELRIWIQPHPEPARCRAAVLTAPGKVPHAKKRSQLSTDKDPKINNWILNSCRGPARASAGQRGPGAPTAADIGGTPWCCVVAVGRSESHLRHDSPVHELLAAVDVVGRAGNRCVSHEVDGERGDVGRADHAPDGERRAELGTAGVQLVAEQ